MPIVLPVPTPALKRMNAVFLDNVIGVRWKIHDDVAVIIAEKNGLDVMDRSYGSVSFSYAPYDIELDNEWFCLSYVWHVASGKHLWTVTHTSPPK